MCCLIEESHKIIQKTITIFFILSENVKIMQKITLSFLNGNFHFFHAYFYSSQNVFKTIVRNQFLVGTF